MAETKQITFSYDGKEYTLEYDLKRVKMMERLGFNIHEIDAKPMTLFPQLFWGAFQKHHKGISQDITDEIYKHIKNRDALISKLMDMYIDPINALFDEPSEGNVSWDPNW